MKQLQKKIIIFFIVALHTCLNYAVQRDIMAFKNLTPAMGLSHGDVLCIYQDHEDYIWIGTVDGLNKYDGIEFTNYKYNKKDTSSVSSNYILAIKEDSQNNLWIGTSRGLCKYNRDKNNFERISFYDNRNNKLVNSVTEIFEDNDNRILLCCGNGIFIFDRDKKTFTACFEDSFTPDDLHYCSGICQDKNGNIWISFRSTEDVGLIKYNPVTKETNIYNTKHPEFQLKENSIYCLMADNHNNIWIGYGLKGLDVINEQLKTITSYQKDPDNDNSLSNNSIFSIAQNRDGTILIGTNGGGLNAFNPDTKVFNHFTTSESDRSLLSNSIQELYIGCDGIIWIGCWAGGVSIYDKRLNRFALYRHDKQDIYSLYGSSVTCFTEEKKGNIWIATDGDGINLFDTAEKKFTNFRSDDKNPQTLSSDKVLAIETDTKGGLWTGMWQGGLNYFKIEGTTLTLKKKYKYVDENDPKSNSVFNIYRDMNGKIWVGNFQTGAYLFDPTSEKFKPVALNYPSDQNLTFNGIHDILCDHENYTWFATEGSGLIRMNQKTGKNESFIHQENDSTSLSSNYINVIYEDSKNRLWVGSYEGGLSLFNRLTKSFTNYTTDHGLPDNTIVGILEDDHENLWLSSNDGISKAIIDSANGKIKLSFRNFTIEDGLQSKVFNRWSFFKSNSGEMYFGGLNGFNTFHPDSITDNDKIPLVHITDFLLFNKPVIIGGKNSPLKKHISQTNELILNYKQNFFIFRFIALNYIFSEKNRYAYKMEGFDNQWNYVGNKREATYTNLDPGDYIFRVKGSNNDGFWNESGKSIRIIITPPFWQTWWFILLAIFLLILLVFGFIEYRIYGIKNQRKKLELVVKERTKDLETSNIELEIQKASIQNYVEALKQSNKELEAFSYSVSHDLRSPLRSMSGFSQILIEDYAAKLDKKGKDYLKRIQQRCQQMGYLIDDLLKLSRVTRDDMYFEDLDLGLLVESLAKEFRQMDPERKVKFSIAKHQFVKGDKVLLQIMLRNLIDNAWKFTSKKSEAKIEFGSFQDQGRTVYFLKDNGIGFDMNDSDKLFETFHRQHAEFEGTGIGLSTVQRIIKRHGGEVWAEGNENDGATFYFTIGEIT